MEFIYLVFRLGVVLAIFSFIWGLLQLAFTILRGGLPLPYPVALGLKTIQYFLIADITILFCAPNDEVVIMDAVLSGCILLLYFVGKLQNARMRFIMVQVQSNLNKPVKQNMNLEVAIVVLSMLLFGFLISQPQFAVNDASTWFYTSIIGIEKTPIFGFIFQVLGFVFTLSIILRLINAFTQIISGRAFSASGNNDNEPSDKHFDDYEEV